MTHPLSPDERSGWQHGTHFTGWTAHLLHRHLLNAHDDLHSGSEGLDMLDEAHHQEHGEPWPVKQDDEQTFERDASCEAETCPAGYRESDGDLLRCSVLVGHEGKHVATTYWVDSDTGSEPSAFGTNPCAEVRVGAAATMLVIDDLGKAPMPPSPLLATETERDYVDAIHERLTPGYRPDSEAQQQAREEANLLALSERVRAVGEDRHWQSVKAVLGSQARG